MSFDGKAFGAEMTEIVKGYVDRATAPLLKRIEELEARPLPIDGKDGRDGVDGKDGRDGIDGKDAPGFAEVLKDNGELVIVLQDGTVRRTGIRDGEKGENGTDGKDGRDGFSLDDFDVDKGDDGRTYILKFDGGDIVHEYELTFPVPVYCGVFKEGDTYVPGDLVTWGGSLWHCDKQTTAKPGTDDWTLSVKKGRDGKNG